MRQDLPEMVKLHVHNRGELQLYQSLKELQMK